MLHTSARGSSKEALKGTAKKWDLIGEDPFITHIYMDIVEDPKNMAVWHTQKPKDVSTTDEGKMGLMHMPSESTDYPDADQSGYFAVSLGHMYLPREGETP